MYYMLALVYLSFSFTTSLPRCTWASHVLHVCLGALELLMYCLGLGVLESSCITFCLAGLSHVLFEIALERSSQSNVFYLLQHFALNCIQYFCFACSYNGRNCPQHEEKEKRPAAKTASS